MQFNSTMTCFIFNYRGIKCHINRNLFSSTSSFSFRMRVGAYLILLFSCSCSAQKIGATIEGKGSGNEGIGVGMADAGVIKGFEKGTGNPGGMEGGTGTLKIGINSENVEGFGGRISGGGAKGGVKETGDVSGTVKGSSGMGVAGGGTGTLQTDINSEKVEGFGGRISGGGAKGGVKGTGDVSGQWKGSSGMGVAGGGTGTLQTDINSKKVERFGGRISGGGVKGGVTGGGSMRGTSSGSSVGVSSRSRTGDSVVGSIGGRSSMAGQSLGGGPGTRHGTLNSRGAGGTVIFKVASRSGGVPTLQKTSRTGGGKLLQEGGSGQVIMTMHDAAVRSQPAQAVIGGRVIGARMQGGMIGSPGSASAQGAMLGGRRVSAPGSAPIKRISITDQRAVGVALMQGDRRVPGSSIKGSLVRGRLSIPGGSSGQVSGVSGQTVRTLRDESMQGATSSRIVTNLRGGSGSAVAVGGSRSAVCSSSNPNCAARVGAQERG